MGSAWSATEAAPPEERDGGEMWYARVETGNNIIAAALELGWTHVMVRCNECGKFDDEAEQNKYVDRGYVLCPYRYEYSMRIRRLYEI